MDSAAGDETGSAADRAGCRAAPLNGPLRAVPLYALGDVKPVRTPDEQWRENQQPAIFVTAELNEDEAGLGSVVADIRGWMAPRCRCRPATAGKWAAIIFASRRRSTAC